MPDTEYDEDNQVTQQDLEILEDIIIIDQEDRFDENKKLDQLCETKINENIHLP